METGLQELPQRIDPDVGVPLSQRIRQRLRRAGVRFHANDNIADYLREGEVDGLQAEVAEQLEHMLRSLVIDVDADHNTRDTAKRLARMFMREVFSGRYEPAPAVTEFPNVEHLDELMIVGPLRVRSACSHHLCPIMGRPQIQEEAIKQVADLLENRIVPDGLAVVLEADHFCMHWRGTRDDGAKMVNSVMRGSFLKDAALRREFLSLLPGRN
jgi:GTP cyclohydrolase I